MFENESLYLRLCEHICDHLSCGAVAYEDVGLERDLMQEVDSNALNAANMS